MGIPLTWISEIDKIIIQTAVNKDNYDDAVNAFEYDSFLEDCSKYLSLEIKAKY